MPDIYNRATWHTKPDAATDAIWEAQIAKENSAPILTEISLEPGMGDWWEVKATWTDGSGKDNVVTKRLRQAEAEAEYARLKAIIMGAG